MAYSVTPVDVNRGTSGISLTPDMSQEIWAKTMQQSAVMALGQRVALPGRGISIPILATDATAAWTAESTEKQVSNATFSSKTMTPYKLATIMMFSDEFRRDLPALYDEIVRRAPAAIGKKLDETVFAGVAPGTGFDVLTSASAIDISTNTYTQLVAAHTAVATAGGILNGFAIAPQGESILLGAVDGNGHPMFLPNVNSDSAISRIFGAQVVETANVYTAGTPNVVGFAGDWSYLRYGFVDGINIDYTDAATINDGTNQINLWQRNLFAVRIEAEVGVAVKSVSAFAKLTD